MPIRTLLILAVAFAMRGILFADPQPRFEGRKAPAMSMEQAADLARRGAAKQGTKLGNRFLARAEYNWALPEGTPADIKQFSDGPHWTLTFCDPEYNLNEYPASPVTVLVFPNSHVAIFAPQ